MANTDATTLGEGPDLLIPGMDEEGEKLVNKQPDTQLAEAEEKQKYGTSRADRETSYQLADFPVLTGEEEDWRFTPLHRLAGLDLPKGDDLLTGTPGRQSPTFPWKLCHALTRFRDDSDDRTAEPGTPSRGNRHYCCRQR